MWDQKRLICLENWLTNGSCNEAFNPETRVKVVDYGKHLESAVSGKYTQMSTLAWIIIQLLVRERKVPATSGWSHLSSGTTQDWRKLSQSVVVK